MSEQPTALIEPQAAPSGPEPGRRLWPLIAAVLIVAAISASAAVTFLGPGGALILGGCAAGAGVAGVVLWRLPQLRKHFGAGRGRPGKRWSFGWGRKVTGGKRPGGAGLKFPKLGGRGGAKGLGGKRAGLPKLGGKTGALGKLGGKARSGFGKLGGRGKSLGRAVTGKGRLPKLGAGKGRGPGGGKSGGPVRRLLGGMKGKLPKLGARGTGGAGKRIRGLLPGRRKAGGPGIKTGGAPAKGSRGIRARGLLRRAGRRLRHPFTPGKPGGKAAPGNGQGGGKRAALGRGLRTFGRGIRSAYRRGRKMAGAKPGQSPAGKAGTAAAAVLFVPFMAAWAGWKRVRAWWRKRGQESQPEAATADAPEPEPQPAPERHPGPPLGPVISTSTGRRKMSPIDAVTESLDANLGSFEPENVDDLRDFLGGLPDLYNGLAASLNRLAERFCDELPIHPDIGDHLREMAAAAAGQHDLAGEVRRLFDTRHEEDIQRLDNPRPGEEFMDYGNNR